MLPEGQQRGAARGSAGCDFFGLPLDVPTLTAEIPGVGTLTAFRFEPADL